MQQKADRYPQLSNLEPTVAASPLLLVPETFLQFWV